VRYAYFAPFGDWLSKSMAGNAFDTLDHQIGGFFPATVGRDGSILLTSQYGLVDA